MLRRSDQRHLGLLRLGGHRQRVRGRDLTEDQLHVILADQPRHCAGRLQRRRGADRDFVEPDTGPSGCVAERSERVREICGEGSEEKV